MLHNTKLDISNLPATCYIQDSVHLGLKFRNRILNPSIVLPIGNSLVSNTHLKLLINGISKDEHGLVMKDICPDDRQNYKALEKIMKPNVLNALSKYAPGSEGTVRFIEMIYHATSSLCEKGLVPLERVYRIWYTTYFLRIWRKWLLSNSNRSKNEASGYNLTENFITRNSYACVEINAHNLLSLIKMFRNNDMEKYFIPLLFNSQPCEGAFRQFRSMGTINFTKINFTLLELLHLVSRVELLNDIIYFRLNDTGIQFPRNKISEANLNNFKLPSDQELESTIQKACIDALKVSSEFGMHFDVEEIQVCELEEVDVIERANTRESKKRAADAVNIYISDEEKDEDENESVDIDSLRQECSNLKSYSYGTEDLENSPYVEVVGENNKKKIVRKSTFMWLTSTEKGKLPSDRLKRVETAVPSKQQKNSCKRRLVFDNPNELEFSLNIKTEIQLGNWCLFQLQMIERNADNEANFVIGQVLSFKYVKGKSRKEKEYTWEFVPVSPDPNTNNARGIEILASWFEVKSDDTLHPINTANCFYINIKNYIATLSCPPVKPNSNFRGSINTKEKCMEIMKSFISQHISSKKL